MHTRAEKHIQAHTHSHTLTYVHIDKDTSTQTRSRLPSGFERRNAPDEGRLGATNDAPCTRLARCPHVHALAHLSSAVRTRSANSIFSLRHWAAMSLPNRSMRSSFSASSSSKPCERALCSTAASSAFLSNRFRASCTCAYVRRLSSADT
jgi:hypothetical protein